jgi:hypothetical protein
VFLIDRLGCFRAVGVCKDFWAVGLEAKSRLIPYEKRRLLNENYFFKFVINWLRHGCASVIMAYKTPRICLLGS